MVLLSRLVERLGGECVLRGAAPEITDVHVDSRRAAPGSLFAALPGRTSDGARFAGQACERGAAAVLSPRGIDGIRALPNWIHPQARRVAGEAAAVVHGLPARAMRVVGITGTNGKSTVAHLTGQLLAASGARPAVIGTVGYRLWGGESRPATHTTPDATELQRLCRRNVERGGDALVLEVSSHALDQERVAGLELDVAVYTNLTRDHLDYHVDMESYTAAKERIFAYLGAEGIAVINADDALCERMARAARDRGSRVVTYGTGSRADLRASRLQAGPRGTHLFLEGMGVPWTGLFLPLVGRHNVENALAALAAVLALGASSSSVLEELATLSPPSGRLEPVDPAGEQARGFRVLVDYAHTPDALARVLGTLRELLDASADGGRLLCVFGCGGDRDREKRGDMGRAAAELADYVVVTSDNPRGEDPEAILDQVLSGTSSARGSVFRQVDRRGAIRQALQAARHGDVVLVAGKGHETWQQLSDRRIPFDDRRVVIEELP